MLALALMASPKVRACGRRLKSGYNGIKATCKHTYTCEGLGVNGIVLNVCLTTQVSLIWYISDFAV